MLKQKYLKTLSLTAILLLGLSTQVFAVDTEAPPSLNIVIPPATDTEAPPSLTINTNNPTPPADNDAPPSLTINTNNPTPPADNDAPPSLTINTNPSDNSSTSDNSSSSSTSNNQDTTTSGTYSTNDFSPIKGQSDIPEPAQSPKIDKQQAKATQTLNNSKSGKTAKTGPGILIYAIFPLAGYFITRKKKS